MRPCVRVEHGLPAASALNRDESWPASSSASSSASSLASWPAARPHYQDSWSVYVPRARIPADQLMRAFFAASPPWVNALIRLRHRVAPGLGLKCGALQWPSSGMPWQVGDRVGVFRIVLLREGDVVLGEDDWHLDFRTGLHWHRDGVGTRLYLSTLVWPHNLAGRTYLAIVGPFHRRIVPVIARRMAILLATRDPHRPVPGQRRTLSP